MKSLNMGLLGTFDICASGKKPPLPGEYGKYGIRMLVEFSQGGNEVVHHMASKRIQLLWPIELDWYISVQYGRSE
jgi:hypothetical protein